VILAWGVHALTASGALVGTLALLSMLSERFEAAALWMLLALAIDSLDGTLARRMRVAERIPSIDGRRLDDIVDYLNYAIVPTVFLVATDRLLHPVWGALPVVASAYGFSQREAKTEDDFFLGFPSYWNVIALYLWILAVPKALGTALIAAFAVGVFVPWKYVYPSRMHMLQRTTAAAGGLWGAALAVAVAVPERAARLHLAELSLLFPLYYGALSLYQGGLARKRVEASAGRLDDGPRDGERNRLPAGKSPTGPEGEGS
jgi:phosphatidylcholine synthase